VRATAVLISTPLGHVPAPLHTRSSVGVGALNSYSAGLSSVHTSCVVHWRSAAAVGAALSYWFVGSHASSLVWHARRSSLALNEVPATHAAHVRLLVVPPSEANPMPTPHVSLSVHDVTRWGAAMAQNVLAGHAEHVRRAVLLSAEMRSPAPHSGCAKHAVSRWPVLLWYVLAGHAGHVRSAVLLSAEMRSPSPHSGCAEHKASRWLVLFWYVLAGHAEHVRSAVLLSAEMRSPAPHVGCAGHEVSRWGAATAWLAVVEV
jgi:hypothetical protein